MKEQLIIHNGVKVTADWPARIEAAQLLTHYTIGGRKYPRIRFGDEDPRWGRKPCLDCGVLKGQFHVPDCEYEECPACGEGQAGGCLCDIEELRELDEELVVPANPGPFSRWFVISMGCILMVLLFLVVKAAYPLWYGLFEAWLQNDGS